MRLFCLCPGRLARRFRFAALRVVKALHPFRVCRFRRLFCGKLVGGDGIQFFLRTFEFFARKLLERSLELMYASFERAAFLRVRVDLFLLQNRYFSLDAHDPTRDAHDRRVRRNFL